MTPVLHIDRAEGVESPDDESFSCWVTTALGVDTEHSTLNEVELSLRIAGSEEVASMNLQYRGKQGPTNVLSFPVTLPEGVESGLLGDIVICAPLVLTEAAAQHKTPEAHWAHLTVHGVLHLLGYDHQNDSDAESMETLEIAALAALGFTNPYQTSDTQTAGGLSAS